MKFLHTSDWHLGKYLDKFSRLPEQIEVLKEIEDLANQQQVDFVLISGDIFDNYNPPTDAIELFYKTIKNLSNHGQRPVFVIAGNHDSPDRIAAPDPLSRECGIVMFGYPQTKIKAGPLADSGLEILQSSKGFLEIKFPQYAYPLRLLATPYANERRFKKALLSKEQEKNKEEILSDLLEASWKDLAEQYCDQNGVNILMTHLFMLHSGAEKPEEPEDEKSIDFVGAAPAMFTKIIPEQIQYTALGHLHRQQIIDGDKNVYYSGTPLAYSFSEAQQKKYVLITEIEPGAKPQVSKHLLKKGKPLFRKKFKDVDEAVSWLQDHQQSLIELTMQTPEYLTAIERGKLYGAHQGIVSLIPFLEKNNLAPEQTSNIDLSKNIVDLFSDFFESKKEQKPNAEMIKLFNEILATDQSEAE